MFITDKVFGFTVLLLLLLLLRTRDNLPETRDTRRLDYLDKKKNIIDR